MSESVMKFDLLAEFQTSKDCSVLQFALHRFNLIFATAEDCYDYLYLRVYSGRLIKCTNCGGTIERRRIGSRDSNCIHCGKVFSITTGTFFEKTKKIKEWFTAIWFLECGVKINPLRFSQITGLAYSSAWLIFQRVSMVVAENMGRSTQLASSDLFFCLINRRSCSTPAKKHPSEELAIVIDDADFDLIEDTSNFEKENSIHLKLLENEKREHGSNNSDRLDPGERVILDLVTSEPVSFDKICDSTGLAAKQVSSSLALLELASLVKALPGNKYVYRSIDSGRSIESVSKPILSESCRALKKQAEELEDMIKLVHKGISLKYLQNYLALSMCFKFKKKWNCGKLFHACFNSKSISRTKVEATQSPRFVNLATS